MTNNSIVKLQKNNIILQNNITKNQKIVIHKAIKKQDTA